MEYGTVLLGFLNQTTMNSLIANGGKASSFAMSLVAGGEGGEAIFSGADAGYYFEVGQDGEVYQDASQQVGALLTTTRRHGNGGCAGNTVYTGGRGAISVLGTRENMRSCTDGKLPGGGGGGGHVKGFNGANGMVIIHY